MLLSFVLPVAARISNNERGLSVSSEKVVKKTHFVEFDEDCDYFHAAQPEARRQNLCGVSKEVRSSSNTSLRQAVYYVGNKTRFIDNLFF